jgi:hypothetical protein
VGLVLFIARAGACVPCCNRRPRPCRPQPAGPAAPAPAPARPRRTGVAAASASASGPLSSHANSRLPLTCTGNVFRHARGDAIAAACALGSPIWGMRVHAPPPSKRQPW